MKDLSKVIKAKTLIYSTTHDIWGGGLIYIEQLCKYMNLKGVEMYIFSSQPESFTCPTKKMDSVQSKKKRFFSAIAVARKCKKENFKNIILNDLSTLWLAPIFKIYGYNVISLLHLNLQKRNENNFGHSIFQYYLLKFTSKFCNIIFSVGKRNQDVFGKDKVKFIGNYVPDWFFDTPKKKDTKKYDFVIIARLSREKNIPLFLDLLKNMNDNSARKYNALIVGRGPEKKNIEDIILKKGLSDNIILLDWIKREELPEVYDSGKCFVISSYHEGFATTILESHARGMPAIVTKSSGFCREFVEKFNDETGITFESEDLNDQKFYYNLAKFIDDYKYYEQKCITKAKIFSEKNVFEPILKTLK